MGIWPIRARIVVFQDPITLEWERACIRKAIMASTKARNDDVSPQRRAMYAQHHRQPQAHTYPPFLAWQVGRPSTASSTSMMLSGSSWQPALRTALLPSRFLPELDGTMPSNVASGSRLDKVDVDKSLSLANLCGLKGLRTFLRSFLACSSTSFCCASSTVTF